MANLTLRGYDLSDDGPARAYNEDITLVREDLGLFVLADGAGGKGKGDLASALAVRTVENYVGATVRRTHERPDYDRLGTPEQAKRLSAAIHRANQNIRMALTQAPEKAGLATTIVAALLSPRTSHLHIAHVGDSRCYRLRHGRIELLTEDHSVATDLLERLPEVTDEVLANIPRNAVVRALGMGDELRVTLRSVLLAPGDRFLLCSDGLTSFVHFDRIWKLLKAPETASAVATELLSQAINSGSQDNISVIVIDCEELVVDQEHPTRPYNEVPEPPSTRLHTNAREEPSEEDEIVPSSRLQIGPEILSAEMFALMGINPESDYPLEDVDLDEPSGVLVTDDILPVEERVSTVPEAVESWEEDEASTVDVHAHDLEIEEDEKS
jgi:protein phosphatase